MVTVGKKSIINPNSISIKEKEFLEQSASSSNNHTNIGKLEYKNVLVSMPVTFLNELNQFLKLNPTQGTRSGFIVRGVAEYLNHIKNS